MTAVLIHLSLFSLLAGANIDSCHKNVQINRAEVKEQLFLVFVFDSKFNCNNLFHIIEPC